MAVSGSITAPSILHGPSISLSPNHPVVPSLHTTMGFGDINLVAHSMDAYLRSKHLTLRDSKHFLAFSFASFTIIALGTLWKCGFSFLKLSHCRKFLDTWVAALRTTVGLDSRA